MREQKATAYLNEGIVSRTEVTKGKVVIYDNE